MPKIPTGHATLPGPTPLIRAEARDPMPLQPAAKQRYASNIRRLYLYQALTNASLWMPVWIVFLSKDRGLTLSQIYVLAGVGWVVQAIADIPTGALSDALGRKRMVLLGVAVLAVGLGILGSVPGLGGVATGYLLWAIGTALISGTDQALLYESAKNAGREHEFPRISSNSFQIVQGSQAAGAMIGGLLASWRLDAPMITTAVMTAVALVVLWRLLEPPQESETRMTYRETFSCANAYLRQERPVALLIMYSGLVAGTVFFVPFVLFQPEMQSHTVAVAWFGVLFTGLRGAAMLGSRYGERLIRPERLARWMRAVPVLMAALFAVVAFSPAWYMAYGAMVLLAAFAAAIRPQMQDLLNRMLPNRVRATVLSAQSVAMTVFIALMHPAVGAVTDIWSIDAPFVLLGVLVLIAVPTYAPLAAVVSRMAVKRPSEPAQETSTEAAAPALDADTQS